MKRRVIFVPDDYWTNKENPMNPDNITAGDWRRAGALLQHRLNRDIDGVNAILTETIEATRIAALIVALIGTLDAVTEQLLTPLGSDALDEWIEAWTRPKFDPARPPEWTQAAALTVACLNKEPSEMDAIIKEGDDDNITPVILSVIDIYTSACPALATHTGTKVVANGIRTLAGIEAEGER